MREVAGEKERCGQWGTRELRWATHALPHTCAHRLALTLLSGSWRTSSSTPPSVRGCEAHPDSAPPCTVTHTKQACPRPRVLNPRPHVHWDRTHSKGRQAVEGGAEVRRPCPLSDDGHQGACLPGVSRLDAPASARLSPRRRRTRRARDPASQGGPGAAGSGPRALAGRPGRRRREWTGPGTS